MTTLSYQQSDTLQTGPWSARFEFAEAEEWAAFSGDYNPIHFEMARARSFGSEKLIVHGMVAVMPIRFLIAKHCQETTEETEWKRMKALFRKPVPQDTHLEIEHRAAKGVARYSLTNSTSDLIRVRYEPHSPSILDFGEVPVEVPVKVPDERIAAFVQTYGDDLPAWMVADAAVFAGLVRSETDPIWDVVKREADRAWGPQPEPPVVVHAWHSVWHRCIPIMTGSALGLVGRSLSFAVGSVSTDLIEDSNRATLNCRIPLDVLVADDRVMTVELSLIIIRTMNSPF